MITLKELSLENFAGFAKVSVSFDDNITYLMGPNGAGKTTLGVTGLAFVMAGIAQSQVNPGTVIGERFRFINGDATSAKGSVILHDDKIGDIIVRRKITKTGMDLTFEGPTGSNLDQKWLNDVFDIFMINPKKFTQLSPKEQAIVLGIDLSAHDAKIKSLKEKYTAIGRDIKMLGPVVAVAKVDKVDVAQVLQERKEFLEFNAAQEAKTKEINRYQDGVDNIIAEINSCEDEINNLKQLIVDEEAKLAGLNHRMKSGNELIDKLPKAEELKDLAPLEIRLTTASEINVQAAAYDAYVAKDISRKAYEVSKILNVENQEKEHAVRTATIKSMELPFANLSVDEEGQLLLDGKFIKEPYFSTGELIMTVPILMSSRNPNFRYVYIQDFNLLDDVKQKKVIDYLTGKGLQLCIEYVGEKATTCNTIHLIDNIVQDETTVVEDRPILQPKEQLI